MRLAGKTALIAGASRNIGNKRGQCKISIKRVDMRFGLFRASSRDSLRRFAREIAPAYSERV